jgi:putative hydrolase of the HAD superfamily
LLTEQIDLIFPELRPLFGANLFCSANFRVQKPDPESYVRLCLTIGAEPSRTLMIDDMNVNVVGARAAGLRAHWFKSPQALRMALQVFFPSLAV